MPPESGLENNFYIDFTKRNMSSEYNNSLISK